MKKFRDRASLTSRGDDQEGEEHEQIRLVSTPEPLCVKMNDFNVKNGNIGTTKSVIKLDTFSINIFNKAKDEGFSTNPRNIYETYIHQSQTSRNSADGSLLKKCKCTPVEWLIALFPILSWLPKYERRDLPFDLVAGITVGIMQIPQGLAYALLANVQPVIGIYMAFFPVLVYSFMGTSRQISMGTFAVICLMTGKVSTDKMAYYASEQLKINDSSVLLEYSTDDQIMPGSPYTSESIATTISLAVGLWQILIGVCRLGSLSVLLSAELVSGFTTGAAVHVFTSQIKNLLGLSLPRRNGLFKIPLTYADIFFNIETCNWTAIAFSAITIFSLVFYNEVLKPIVSRKFPLPIPVELFTIVIGTLISRFWITSQEYKFQIVNHIPTGLPTPSLPPLEIMQDVVIDALVIAIVAYTISISMAKIFAAKHEYTVRPNQELIANGTSNLIGSLFSCAPISASLSRSLIQEQVGGKTQLAGIFSCSLLVFVLLWIGPLFETLPHCVLSSLIVVALKGMFTQVYDLPAAYKESSLNALVWVASFLSTVFLDIEFGLLVGLIFSIVTLIWRSNKPHINVLGVYSESNVYVDMNITHAKEIPGIKIVKYTGSINFATVEAFVEKLQEIIPAAEPTSKKGANNLGGIIVSTISKEKIDVSIDESLCDFRPGIMQLHESISWIVLDFASVSSIDPAGVKALKSLCKTYLKKEIQILFTGCAPSLIEVMDRCQLINKVAGIEHFFPTVQDAVNYCCVPSFDKTHINVIQGT